MMLSLKIQVSPVDSDDVEIGCSACYTVARHGGSLRPHPGRSLVGLLSA